MELLISSTGRFVRTPDDQLWSYFPAESYSFWRRYLGDFQAVRLLARAEPRAEPPPGYVLATGAGVVAEPLPYYVGPAAFVRAYPQLHCAISRALAKPAAVSLRVPCSLATAVHAQLPGGRPYGVEVVADPFDTFSSGAMRHALRPIFQQVFTHRLQMQVRGATAVSHVPSAALQRRYPARAGAFTTTYSSVHLPEEAFVAAPRRYPSDPPFRLILVGAFDQLNKGQDIALQALRTCRERGIKATLTFVGDGRFRTECAETAERLDLGGQVHFCGRIASPREIYAALDAADLFILPSRQEGVPRAMIEAMARGLPCIGSDVGGIPDLLPGDDLVPRDQTELLADRIAEYIRSPAKFEASAARNLEAAQRFAASELQPKRRNFCAALHERTLPWLAQRAASKS